MSEMAMSTRTITRHPATSTGGRVTKLAALVAVTLLAGGCMDITSDADQDPAPLEEVEFDASLGIDLDDFQELPAGLLIREDLPGSDPTATPGAELEVELTGWLPSGESFTEPGEFTAFRLGMFGNPEVVAGIHEGVNGMQAGAIRTLLIPPYLGYGGAPPQESNIPVQSWLVYRVTLLTVDGNGPGPD